MFYHDVGKMYVIRETIISIYWTLLPQQSNCININKSQPRLALVKHQVGA